MANTLLDAIRQNQQKTMEQSSALGAGPSAGEAGQQVQALTGVAQTGKVQAPGPSSKMSALQERVAALQGQMGLNQVAQQSTEAQQELAGNAELAEKASRIQDEALEEKRQQTRTQFNQNIQAVLNSYSQQGRQLNLAKDKSRMEQLGFNLRLGNDKYVHDLQMRGSRERLQTHAGMNENIARTVFADEQEMLSDSLEFREMMGQKQRDLTESLANMDLEQALQMANAGIQGANQRLLWTGVGNMAAEGVDLYYKENGGPAKGQQSEGSD